MTHATLSSGTTNILTQIVRGAVLLIAAIGGFFVLAASAAVAFFILLGLIVLGLVTASVFWVRAKLTGQRFGARAEFQRAYSQAYVKKGAAKGTSHSRSDDTQGPIIDAHETPQGWSVDQ